MLGQCKVLGLSSLALARSAPEMVPALLTSSVLQTSASFALPPTSDSGTDSALSVRAV